MKFNKANLYTCVPPVTMQLTVLHDWLFAFFCQESNAPVLEKSNFDQLLIGEKANKGPIPILITYIKDLRENAFDTELQEKANYLEKLTDQLVLTLENAQKKCKGGLFGKKFFPAAEKPKLFADIMVKLSQIGDLFKTIVVEENHKLFPKDKLPEPISFPSFAQALNEKIQNIKNLNKTYAKTTEFKNWVKLNKEQKSNGEVKTNGHSQPTITTLPMEEEEEKIPVKATVALNFKQSDIESDLEHLLTHLSSIVKKLHDQVNASSKEGVNLKFIKDYYVDWKLVQNIHKQVQNLLKINDPTALGLRKECDGMLRACINIATGLTESNLAVEGPKLMKNFQVAILKLEQLVTSYAQRDPKFKNILDEVQTKEKSNLTTLTASLDAVTNSLLSRAGIPPLPSLDSKSTELELISLFTHLTSIINGLSEYVKDTSRPVNYAFIKKYYIDRDIFTSIYNHIDKLQKVDSAALAQCESCQASLKKCGELALSLTESNVMIEGRKIMSNFCVAIESLGKTLEICARDTQFNNIFVEVQNKEKFQLNTSIRSLQTSTNALIARLNTTSSAASASSEPESKDSKTEEIEVPPIVVVNDQETWQEINCLGTGGCLFNAYSNSIIAQYENASTKESIQSRFKTGLFNEVLHYLLLEIKEYEPLIKDNKTRYATLYEDNNWKLIDSKDPEYDPNILFEKFCATVTDLYDRQLLLGNALRNYSIDLTLNNPVVEETYKQDFFDAFREFCIRQSFPDKRQTNESVFLVNSAFQTELKNLQIYLENIPDSFTYDKFDAQITQLLQQPIADTFWKMAKQTLREVMKLPHVYATSEYAEQLSNYFGFNQTIVFKKDGKPDISPSMIYNPNPSDVARIFLVYDQKTGDADRNRAHFNAKVPAAWAEQYNKQEAEYISHISKLIEKQEKEYQEAAKKAQTSKAKEAETVKYTLRTKKLTSGQPEKWANAVAEIPEQIELLEEILRQINTCTKIAKTTQTPESFKDHKAYVEANLKKFQQILATIPGKLLTAAQAKQIQKLANEFFSIQTAVNVLNFDAKSPLTITSEEKKQEQDFLEKKRDTLKLVRKLSEIKVTEPTSKDMSIIEDFFPVEKYFNMLFPDSTMTDGTIQSLTKQKNEIETKYPEENKRSPAIKLLLLKHETGIAILELYKKYLINFDSLKASKTLAINPNNNKISLSFAQFFEIAKCIGKINAIVFNAEENSKNSNEMAPLVNSINEKMIEINRVINSTNKNKEFFAPIKPASIKDIKKQLDQSFSNLTDCLDENQFCDFLLFWKTLAIQYRVDTQEIATMYAAWNSVKEKYPKYAMPIGPEIFIALILEWQEELLELVIAVKHLQHPNLEKLQPNLVTAIKDFEAEVNQTLSNLNSHANFILDETAYEKTDTIIRIRKTLNEEFNNIRDKFLKITKDKENPDQLQTSKDKLLAVLRSATGHRQHCYNLVTYLQKQIFRRLREADKQVKGRSKTLVRNETQRGLNLIANLKPDQIIPSNEVRLYWLALEEEAYSIAKDLDNIINQAEDLLVSVNSQTLKNAAKEIEESTDSLEKLGETLLSVLNAINTHDYDAAEQIINIKILPLLNFCTQVSQTCTDSCKATLDKDLQLANDQLLNKYKGFNNPSIPEIINNLEIVKSLITTTKSISKFDEEFPKLDKSIDNTEIYVQKIIGLYTNFCSAVDSMKKPACSPTTLKTVYETGHHLTAYLNDFIYKFMKQPGYYLNPGKQMLEVEALKSFAIDDFAWILASQEQADKIPTIIRTELNELDVDKLDDGSTQNRLFDLKAIAKFAQYCSENAHQQLQKKIPELLAATAKSEKSSEKKDLHEDHYGHIMPLDLTLKKDNRRASVYSIPESAKKDNKVDFTSTSFDAKDCLMQIARLTKPVDKCDSNESSIETCKQEIEELKNKIANLKNAKTSVEFQLIVNSIVKDMRRLKNELFKHKRDFERWASATKFYIGNKPDIDKEAILTPPPTGSSHSWFLAQVLDIQNAQIDSDTYYTYKEELKKANWDTSKIDAVAVLSEKISIDNLLEIQKLERTLESLPNQLKPDNELLEDALEILDQYWGREKSALNPRRIIGKVPAAKQELDQKLRAYVENKISFSEVEEAFHNYKTLYENTDYHNACGQIVAQAKKKNELKDIVAMMESNNKKFEEHFNAYTQKIKNLKRNALIVEEAFANACELMEKTWGDIRGKNELTLAMERLASNLEDFPKEPAKRNDPYLTKDDLYRNLNEIKDTHKKMVDTEDYKQARDTIFNNPKGAEWQPKIIAKEKTAIEQIKNLETEVAKLTGVSSDNDKTYLAHRSASEWVDKLLAEQNVLHRNDTQAFWDRGKKAVVATAITFGTVAAAGVVWWTGPFGALGAFLLVGGLTLLTGSGIYLVHGKIAEKKRKAAEQKAQIEFAVKYAKKFFQDYLPKNEDKNAHDKKLVAYQIISILLTERPNFNFVINCIYDLWTSDPKISSDIADTQDLRNRAVELIDDVISIALKQTNSSYEIIAQCLNTLHNSSIKPAVKQEIIQKFIERLNIHKNALAATIARCDLETQDQLLLPAIAALGKTAPISSDIENSVLRGLQISSNAKAQKLFVKNLIQYAEETDDDAKESVTQKITEIVDSSFDSNAIRPATAPKDIHLIEIANTINELIEHQGGIPLAISMLAATNRRKSPHEDVIKYLSETAQIKLLTELLKGPAQANPELCILLLKNLEKNPNALQRFILDLFKQGTTLDFISGLQTLLEIGYEKTESTLAGANAVLASLLKGMEILPTFGKEREMAKRALQAIFTAHDQFYRRLGSETDRDQIIETLYVENARLRNFFLAKDYESTYRVLADNTSTDKNICEALKIFFPIGESFAHTARAADQLFHLLFKDAAFRPNTGDAESLQTAFIIRVLNTIKRVLKNDDYSLNMRGQLITSFINFQKSNKDTLYLDDEIKKQIAEFLLERTDPKRKVQLDQVTDLLEVVANSTANVDGSMNPEMMFTTLSVSTDEQQLRDLGKIVYQLHVINKDSNELGSQQTALAMTLLNSKEDDEKHKDKALIRKISYGFIAAMFEDTSKAGRGLRKILFDQYFQQLPQSDQELINRTENFCKNILKTPKTLLSDKEKVKAIDELLGHFIDEFHFQPVKLELLKHFISEFIKKVFEAQEIKDEPDSEAKKYQIKDKLIDTLLTKMRAHEDIGEFFAPNDLVIVPNQEEKRRLSRAIGKATAISPKAKKSTSSKKFNFASAASAMQQFGAFASHSFSRNKTGEREPLLRSDVAKPLKAKKNKTDLIIDETENSLHEVDEELEKAKKDSEKVTDELNRATGKALDSMADDRYSSHVSAFHKKLISLTSNDMKTVRETFQTSIRSVIMLTDSSNKEAIRKTIFEIIDAYRSYLKEKEHLLFNDEIIAGLNGVHNHLPSNPFKNKVAEFNNLVWRKIIVGESDWPLDGSLSKAGLKTLLERIGQATHKPKGLKTWKSAQISDEELTPLRKALLALTKQINENNYTEKEYVELLSNQLLNKDYVKTFLNALFSANDTDFYVDENEKNIEKTVRYILNAYFSKLDATSQHTFGVELQDWVKSQFSHNKIAIPYLNRAIHELSPTHAVPATTAAQRDSRTQSGNERTLGDLDKLQRLIENAPDSDPDSDDEHKSNSDVTP